MSEGADVTPRVDIESRFKNWLVILGIALGTIASLMGVIHAMSLQRIDENRCEIQANSAVIQKNQEAIATTQKLVAVDSAGHCMLLESVRELRQAVDELRETVIRLEERQK